jgi:hypothetical protein
VPILPDIRHTTQSAVLRRDERTLSAVELKFWA